MNRLVMAFIGFMDYSALEDQIKAGLCTGYSLQNVRGLKKSALDQLMAMREDAETFDNQYYSAVIQSMYLQASEHEGKGSAWMALFLEYCQFQCGLKSLSNEPTVRDELEEHGLEALAVLKPDNDTFRSYSEELVSIFEGYVSSGLSCLGPEYRVLAEIVDCASAFYDIEVSAAVALVVKHHFGGDDEDSDPPSPTQFLQ